MKKFTEHIFLTVAMLATSLTLSAQEISVSADAAEGMIIPKDEAARNMMNALSMKFYGASVSWTSSGDSVSLDDETWGRPTLSAGILLGDYHRVTLHREDLQSTKDITYRSRFGYMITPYVGFRRPLLRSSRITTGYKFENGIGICTDPYNTRDNAENFFVGGRMSIFIGMGLYGAIRLSHHFSIGLDATFRHYSNGRTTQPNVGINTVDVGIRATYTVEPDTVTRDPYYHGFNRNFKKHIYMDINAGWCPQTLISDWDQDFLTVPEKRRTSYHVYNAWAAEIAMMWRYSRKYASGIGLDYTFIPFTNEILASDAVFDRHPDYELSKHVLGLSLRHEVFYKNISLHASLGYFLHKRLGVSMSNDQKPYYETVGLRWYLPVLDKRLYIGYNINACAIKANYFQFSIGYTPFSKK